MAQRRPLDIQPLDIQPLDINPNRSVFDTPTDLPDAEPGFLSKIYDSVMNAPEFITEPARNFAESTMPGMDFTTDPSIPEWIRKPIAMAKGFYGGTVEGAAGQASPANLLTAGRGKLPQIAGQVLGSGQMLHGGHELLQGNVTEGLGDIGFGALGIAGGKPTKPAVKPRISIPAVVDEGIPSIESTKPGFFDRMDPNMNQGMGDPELAGTMPYKMGPTPLDVQPLPKPSLATSPMGQTIIIRQKNATPEIIKQAQEAGFKFVDLNDQGNFRFKKVGPGTTQPILESEVGTVRPTKSAIEGQLGPKADVKKSSTTAEIFNLPRALKASMDFSAPLRQGITLIHKPEFWTSLKPMVKAWANEDAFRASQDAIAQRAVFTKRAGPNGKVLPSFADDAGLKLTDLTDLSSREEALMSTWAEKFPGVRRSNRAYTAFLNNLRADTFESLVREGNVLGADVKGNSPLARALADFVNTASGRGSLGKLESSAVALNTLLFSPRLIASRLKLLNPAYYVMAPPQVRKEAMKSLVALTATGNIVTQLGKMAGGEVSSDPSSSDFGKLKIGNIRVDPYGGFQQYVVAANRLLNPAGPATGFKGETPVTRGQMVTSSTSGNEYDLWNPEPGPFDPSPLTVAARFGRGKLHPVLGFASSLFGGMKDMAGKELNFSTMNPLENALSQQFIPLVVQDLYELAQDPDASPELKALLALGPVFGMGVQTYQPEE